MYEKFCRSMIASLIIVFGIGIGFAQATPILDQEFVPSPTANDHWASFDQSTSTNPLYFGDQAQTFTVGLTGILDSVDVFIGRNSDFLDPLFVDIRYTFGGVPMEADFHSPARVEVPASNVPVKTDLHDYSFVHVDLSFFDLSVNAGDVLAIVLQSNAPWAGYWWGGRASFDEPPIDPYTSGGHFYRGFSFAGPSPVWAEPIRVDDLGFKTYVAPVPEPATMLLFGSGLIGLAAFRRKFRKK